jgi:hypothetical protein
MRKTYHLKHNSFVLAVACAALAWGTIVPAVVSGAGKTSPAPAQKTEDTGRLVIVRSANLGQAVVGVSIDGVQTAKINYNGRYDAPLAVGQHVVTVVPIPNREFGKPSQTRLTVEKGKTYAFTAKRDDVAIVLK